MAPIPLSFDAKSGGVGAVGSAVVASLQTPRAPAFPSSNSSADISAATKSGTLCVSCKGGKLLCGLSSCPILERISVIAPKAEQVRARQEVCGPAPNLFVGHAGYPNVFAGPLVSYDDSVDKSKIAFYDDPSKWFGQPVSSIIDFRASFARGMQRVGVSSRTRYLDDVALAVMAETPADMEVSFSRPPSFRLSFSDTVQPMGPSERFSHLRLASNPVVPAKIDSIVSENLAVRDALPELLEHGFGHYYLQKLLCAGILGKKDRKKMVPTRWSITASDRVLADEYLKNVRDYDCVPEFAVYSSNYLDNHFEILVMPGCWEFEQFESWAPGTAWNPFGTSASLECEYEPYGGRSDYAESEGGGYYAGRLAAAEALHGWRKQGKVVIIREIGEGYTVPVGVWEVRENARHAFSSGPLARFSSLSDSLAFLRGRLKHDFSHYLAKSSILSQRRISAYF